MFEINSLLLRSMGWKDYSHYRGFSVNIPFNSDNSNILFYILLEDRKLIYYIEGIEEKKQLQKSKIYNGYKFAKLDFSKKKLKTVQENFESNMELMKLIKKNLCCNLSRQRFFQINSIIK